LTAGVSFCGIKRKTALRVVKGVIAVTSFEARITCPFARLNPPEKVFEGFIKASQCVLNYLRMDRPHKGISLFLLFQVIRLLGIANCAVFGGPCLLALSKGGIVHMTTGGEPLGKNPLLLIRRI
jgi:hypothetical protein